MNIDKGKIKKFAEGCLNHNSLEELQEKHKPPDADITDLSIWDITPLEWSIGIEIALRVMKDEITLHEIMSNRHKFLNIKKEVEYETERNQQIKTALERS